MKKVLSLVLTMALLLSVAFVLPVGAEEEVSFKNAICTIENENGFLSPTGEERGKALTVSENELQWRFKEFLGGSYSFVGNGDLAADVNGASVDEGVTIIQWTSTGANNQRWMIEEAEGGYYIKSVFSNLYMTETEGVITQEAKDESKNQLWKITKVGEFEPLVEKMLESEAAKSLSEYRYDRLCAFLLSGGEFNLLTYDKVEAMIKERDYFNLALEEQSKFVEECFTVVPTDLMYGSMATKLKKDIKVEYVGIEEGAWQSWHGIPEEAPRLYNVTITDTESGDSHVMQYISPYDNDEEYAATVGEAVACFEMPIVKVLWRFVYTSMNTSSWNGGDGTIWNNTGYRGDVNNMVQMFAHELGHVMDNGRQNNDVWYRAIAQDMVPVTGYGNTNRWEDLAEFSRLYLLAKGDKDRIAAIENTYPARTKAYKALLYAVDFEFYKDYVEEFREVTNIVDDNLRTNTALKITGGGGYLTVKDGKLVTLPQKDVIADWQSWDVYTTDAKWGLFRNKATNKYLAVVDGKLTINDTGSYLGFKDAYTMEKQYQLIDSATGFSVMPDYEFGEDDPKYGSWEFVYAGSLGGKSNVELSLHVNGEKLGFIEDEGIVMNGEELKLSFVPVEKDYFTVSAKQGLFDVSGNSVLNGAKVIFYSSTGGDNQRVKLVNNGDGSYKIQFKHSGLYLTWTEDGLCQSDGRAGYVNWVIE